MYFSLFPNTTRNDQVITDLTVRIEFVNRIKNNTTLFEHVQVSDGETPEILAYRYYKNAGLHWIIMLINDIAQYSDWIMSDSLLLEYVKEKYGEDNIYATHHIEDSNGDWTNNSGPTTYPVTNFGYEQQLNEEKRKIKIIKKDYIPQILEEYKNELYKIV